MNKGRIWRFIVILVCILCMATGVVFAATVEDGNNFFLAGKFFEDAHQNGTVGTNNDATIVATYNGEAITRDIVEYHKNMNILRSDEAAEGNDTDIEIINNIITNMMLFEEAERLGFTATEAEIEELVQNATRAYSIPEGKEIMDAYCNGAGITFDEYLVLLREQAPSMIARQKLKDAFCKQYCEENGLEFTRVNPPAEMVAAQDAYIADLFEQNKDKIEYFIDVTVTS